jgi:hypothetical protein
MDITLPPFHYWQTISAIANTLPTISVVVLPQMVPLKEPASH